MVSPGHRRPRSRRRRNDAFKLLVTTVSLGKHGNDDLRFLRWLCVSYPITKETSATVDGTSSSSSLFSFARFRHASLQDRCHTLHQLVIISEWLEHSRGAQTERTQQKMPELDAEKELRDNRFSYLLQPIRDLAANWDINIAGELEEYLDELEHLTFTIEGCGPALNFAEAALLIQVCGT